MTRPRVYSFALPIALFNRFDYCLPVFMSAVEGARYRVPFGSGFKTALLLAPAAFNPQLKLKQVDAQLDEKPVLSAHLLALCDWAASYYCQPQGEMLFHALPVQLRKGKPAQDTRETFWRSVTPEPMQTELAALKKKAPRQYQLYQAIRTTPTAVDALTLKEVMPDWRTPLLALEKKGWVSASFDSAGEPLIAERQVTLTRQQQQCIDGIASDLKRFQIHLLHGVTGSGKTEVYLEVMRQIVTQGKQVIFLVPEIGLTPQLQQRIEQVFVKQVVVSHSSQTPPQRYRSWDRFRRGAAAVMLGTRSSLFCEFAAPGLIVMDEEHDTSYRQQDGVRYHARDLAIKRAQMLQIPVVLGSATPSLETLHNLQKPYFQLHRLETRVTGKALPKIQLLDIKDQPLQAGCSESLLSKVSEHLQQGGQVLFYLNRRGFAPVVMCHACSWQARCEHCDARLTLHRSTHRLICHHCGYQQPMPAQCPNCGEADIQHYGVGTQQLESFLSMRFPEVPVTRIDRDSVTTLASFTHSLQRLNSGAAHILIGTQMLSKGHDYPDISLVVILDADQALFSGFYRASERLLQTVVQVTGRAGRAHRAGEALLQTAFVEHPLLQSLTRENYATLAAGLLAERRQLALPPFARVATVHADSVQLETAQTLLEKIVEAAQLNSALQSGKRTTDQKSAAVRLIGPLPALMTRRKGRFRAQFSLVSEDFEALRTSLNRLMAVIKTIKVPSRVKLVVEVDPQDL